MKRKALLLITTSYPRKADGSEAAGAFVADLAEALSSRLPVRVVGPGMHETQAGPEEGVRVWCFSAGDRPLSLLSPASPLNWPRIFKILLSMRRQAIAATADGEVCHVIAFWLLPSGWVARSLQRQYGVGYSVWALGSDIWSMGRLPGARAGLRWVASGATRCFADGLKLADDASLLTGRAFEFLPSTRRALVVGAQAPRARGPWKLLFLGRWHPNKGVDLLLEALDGLPDASWADIESITLAGGGPLEPEVCEGVSRLQARGLPVRLCGFLSAPQAGQALASTDWVLIPSRIESIPVVLSDALKAGRPVVVTPVGDMDRIVRGGLPCGVVADEASSEAFRAALQAALAVSPLRFSKGVMRTAAQFDVQRIASRIAEMVGSEPVRQE